MPHTPTAKQQYWIEHLQQVEAFDGSLADYARTQGLSVRDLYRWRNRLKSIESIRTPIQPTFTQVVATPMHSPSLTVEVASLQLHFSRLPDAQWLAQLLILNHTP